MRTLAFDGRSGASGDMLLGALLAAGADRDRLDPVESALPVRYEVGEAVRHGIAATTVDVVSTNGDRPAEGAGGHRTYPEVVEIVEGMALADEVEARALSAFERLAAAEAAVHGTEIEGAHFHEVGADDAVADVVGVALLIDDLAPDRIVTTPPAAGGGEVETSHGRYPVPPPAVVEIAAGADWELRGGPVEAELLTPTGAALLAALADGVDALPSMRVEASGYGAGDRELEDRPNVLRAVVGESRDLAREEIAVLETNLDDATPEVLGGLQERLAAAGARDVSVVPATMKKSRPGHLVKVIARPEDAERVAWRLAEETGTLGVRQAGATHRWVASRRFVTATVLESGERHRVAVKVGEDAGGTAYDLSAEYDDAAAVAAETGLPVREVARRAEAAAREGGALADALVHVVDGEGWREFLEGERYAPPSLEEEGFVHLAAPDAAARVARARFPDAERPRLLVVDRERVGDDLRFEETPDGAFPHLYGALGTDAIREVREFPREDGRYRPPDL